MASHIHRRSGLSTITADPNGVSQMEVQEHILMDTVITALCTLPVECRDPSEELALHPFQETKSNKSNNSKNAHLIPNIARRNVLPVATQGLLVHSLGRCSR